MQTFTARLRNDKSKTPALRTYRYLTYAECKALSGHALYLDMAGNVATVKITTVKTWKRKDDIEVHCKYGLYEYFTDTITPTSNNVRFVVEVDPITVTTNDENDMQVYSNAQNKSLAEYNAQNFTEPNARTKKYLELLASAYNPRRHMIIQSFREVGRIVADMVRDGYTTDEVYTICDLAREKAGLEPIQRKA